MYVIKQHSYPSAPRYVAHHSLVPGVPTKWADNIHDAAKVACKRLASLYVEDIPDTVYIKLAYAITLEGEDKVYYIEKIVGPHTVCWTDKIDKALKFVRKEDAADLAAQYGSTVKAVES